MAVVMHIEIDALCLLVLCAIAWQSLHNVSQQMGRVLFRNLVYGIIAALALDIIWMLVDGRRFPGAIAANLITNALFLSTGVALGCVWYLYVLETLGHNIGRRLEAAIMVPAVASLILNLASIKTGWIFFVTPENVYVRGPLFWIQEIDAYGMLFVSLIHILIHLIRGGKRSSLRDARKLLGFYIIPVIGAVASMPFTGLPGTWTCAAISVVLMYIDDQDREILRDSLTGLNNRKTLDAAFADYVRQLMPGMGLYLFMMDLDNFKRINDTFGHPAGDQALVTAAKALTRSVSGIRAIIARFGGDEFLVMGFFDGDSAVQCFKNTVRENLEASNREQNQPFRLAMSIGFARYQPGQSFDEFVECADKSLYDDKTHRRAKR